MARSIEIPCGRYDYDPQTKRVSILKAKGVLTLSLNEEDELHLKWLNVDQNYKVEIDRFIFNNDTKFERVKGQNRVYYLSFQSEDTKLFFYMQGNDINQDEQYCTQFNELVHSQILEDQINLPNLPQPQSQPMQQEVQALPQMNQQQIQAIIRQMMTQQQHQQHISLNDVINQDFLHTILNDEESINKLIELLPEGQQDASKFQDNLLSPQLRQAMDQLSHALRDKDRAGVISQLGLDYTILETEFDGVIAFCKAIIKAVEQEQKPQQQ